MSVSRKQALAQGEKAIERPKGQMEVTLYHGVTGLTLRYQGQVIARTHASAVGKQLAPYVALALGASLPGRRRVHEGGGQLRGDVSSAFDFLSGPPKRGGERPASLSATRSGGDAGVQKRSHRLAVISRTSTWVNSWVLAVPPRSCVTVSPLANTSMTALRTQSAA